jgi:hypothetical protein
MLPNGINPTHLSELEGGRRNPTLWTFARLLDALGDSTLARFLAASARKPLTRQRVRTRRA